MSEIDDALFHTGVALEVIPRWLRWFRFMDDVIHHIEQARLALTIHRESNGPGTTRLG